MRPRLAHELAYKLAIVLALSAAPAGACAVDPFMNSPFQGSLTVDMTSTGQLARVWFAGPSDIYDHFVLGRTVEPTLLFVQFAPGSTDCGSAFAAGDGQVFEDTAPRLADLDGDGENEVIVVRSHVDKGAQLAVYGIRNGEFGLIAATDHIGQPHRWLAPAGIADFDGDGRVEIAYVDRPHLLGELVFVRLNGKRLVELARLPGVSNHRIGDTDISGGVRDCGAGPEAVLASKDFSRVLAVGWGQGGPKATDLGPFSDRALRTALTCP